VVFGGSNRWDIRNTAGTASLNTAPPGSAYKITKTGTNQVSLVGVTTVDPALGDIDIQQGTFAVQTSTVRLGDPAHNVIIHSNAVLNFFTLSTPFNKNIVLQDGGTLFNEKGPSYISGGSTITLQGNATINAANNGTPPVLNCSNAIVGSGNLVLTGGGILALAGTNTYTGSTLVNAGTLMLTNSGSISNSPLVNIAAGAVLAANNGGFFVVNSGQTLAGNGSIVGAMNLKTNATLSPGNGGTGILTVSGVAVLAGTVAMELNKAAHTNDVLATASTIFYAGGTLALTNLSGTLTATDTFKLFQATSYSVSGLLKITPASPGAGLAWNTNTLTIDGTLRIATATLPSPGFTTAAIAGNGFVFSGTNGLPNYPYMVLMTTNIALPRAQWTVIATNTFDPSGNFIFTNTINPTSPSTFYLLQMQ